MDPVNGRPDPDEDLTIRIHCADLRPKDASVVNGIPVTAPARTLLDLASTLGQSELEQAMAAALARHLTSSSELVEVMARYPRHRGVPRLAALLEG